MLISSHVPRVKNTDYLSLRHKQSSGRHARLRKMADPAFDGDDGRWRAPPPRWRRGESVAAASSSSARPSAVTGLWSGGTPTPCRGAVAARRMRSSRAACSPASGVFRRWPFARASTGAVSGAGAARRRQRRWRRRRRRDGGVLRGSRTAQQRRRRGYAPSEFVAALQQGQRMATAKPATMPPLDQFQNKAKSIFQLKANNRPNQ